MASARRRAGPPGLFRIGDQAAVIPSFTGEGIALALHSGLAAAAAILAGEDAAAFQAALAPPQRRADALGRARRLGAAAGAGRLHRRRRARAGGPAAGARHPRQSMLSPSRATIAFSYSTRCLAKARYSAGGRYSFGMSQRLMIAWLASSS